MKLEKSNLTMTISAAAVALALGVTAPALAQQSQQSDSQGARQERQQSQQSHEGGSRDRTDASQAQHNGQQGSAQDGSSQRQRAGNSELDRVVQMHSELGTFVEALETTGLAEELAGDTKYTIFAPTNEAFDSMQQDVAELMRPENRDQLVALLRSHIVADDVDPQQARSLEAAKTLDGGTIPLSVENDKLMIGDANVVTPDIEVQGANLRIYSIDEVLDDGRQRSASAPSDTSRG